MFSRKEFGAFRVFSLRGINRQKGDVRRWTRWWRGLGVARATTWCGCPLVCLQLSFGLHLRVR
jgi:hypothetical protein